MLKFEKATGLDHSDGKRLVVSKDGKRIGVFRIDKDESTWIFRADPDKASIKLSKLQEEPVVELTSEELLALHKAVSTQKV